VSKAEAIIELNKFPNIGKILAERLFFAGIESPKHLLDMGTQDAFIRLLAYDSTACIHQLYAIEGAVRGFRWHDLSKSKKNDLLDFYKSLKVY
jgi:DNA transformation protein